VSSIGVCKDLYLVMLCGGTAVSVTPILKQVKVHRLLSLCTLQEHVVL
jgi:hypothetical protein